MKKKKIQQILSNVVKPILELMSRNKILTLILFIAFFVRILGLYPNFINHPDEGWVQTYSEKLFYNIIAKGDFNSYTYKYGSFIFYLAAIPYFPIIFISYLMEGIQSVFLPFNITYSMPSFIEYVAKIGYSQHQTLIFWSQRALVMLLGTASVLILYLIAKKLLNKPIALLAAFSFAIFPFHVRDSHYLTTDVPATFFILLAILFMVNLFKTGKLKWYLLSGFMIGFSTAVRYFPVALLVYPIAILLDKQKNKMWPLRIILGFIAVPIGIFVGLPYLFLNSQSHIIFQQDMEKWVLPWYSTTISTYVSSLASFVLSNGQGILPNITTLTPNEFLPYYASFIFFKGLGQIPTIASLIGLGITLLKFPKQFIFLSIIPFITFIYISSYMHAQYERLAIPITPFLALFIGVFIHTFWNRIKQFNTVKAKVIFGIVCLSVFYYPFTQSFSSSWACGQKTVYQQSQEWIADNMPYNPRVAYKTYISFPSKDFDKLIEIKPTENFSLEEVRDTHSDYAFINKSNALGYYAYRFDTDFFIPPSDIYENNFVLLSLYEYETRATLLKELSKPDMCAQDNLLFYKLPPLLPESKNLIKNFSFETINDTNFWHLQTYSIPSKKVEMLYAKNEGIEKGALEYRWENIFFTAPKIVSQRINVTGGKIYTFSGWIKSNQILKSNERDGFLRIDFYKDPESKIILPGNAVALSPRIYGDPEWKKVSVSAIAPNGTSFAIVSLNVTATKSSGSFYFDNLQFFGP
ncbi:MAG: glycosyltransferase family 39 protein [Candidatus Levybacteria bacterium]|nr:glycosyltransferase family 39 protein [Candidatus Levybacteria bacterium]